MHYVYGEEVIIVNFIGDFMILATVMLARNKRFSFFRCSIGAAIGVFYAFGAIIWSNFMVSLPLKLAISFGMAFIISKSPNLKEILLNAALIVFTSFVSAGCILFFSYVFTSALYIAGGYLFSSNYLLLSLGMLTGCLSVKQIYGIMNKYLSFDRLICPCTAIHKNKMINISLLADSGNLLRTPTGKNVIILNHEIFSSLTEMQKTKFGCYEEYENYYQTLCEKDQFNTAIILAQTIHSTEYLLVTKIDEIRFENGFILYKPYIASGNIESAKGEFNGIFNPILLKRRFEHEFYKKTQ